MKSTRLHLGQVWHDRINKHLHVPRGVTLKHPYISEHLETLKEPAEKPKKKKVK